MKSDQRETEGILESLSEQQHKELYECYCKLNKAHNMNEQRIMRMLKLKEYELKTLLSKATENKIQ